MGAHVLDLSGGFPPRSGRATVGLDRQHTQHSSAPRGRRGRLTTPRPVTGKSSRNGSLRQRIALSDRLTAWTSNASGSKRPPAQASVSSYSSWLGS